MDGGSDEVRINRHGCGGGSLLATVAATLFDMITTSIIQSAFDDMLTAFDGMNATIRHNDRTYTALRSTLQKGEEIGLGIGTLETAEGAVRVGVASLGPDHPSAGDQIEIQEQAGGDWITRYVIEARYDQARATLYIAYGGRFN